MADHLSVEAIGHAVMQQPWRVGHPRTAGERRYAGSVEETQKGIGSTEFS